MTFPLGSFLTSPPSAPQAQPNPTGVASLTGGAQVSATQTSLVDEAHVNARQLRELNRELQLTQVQLIQHAADIRAEVIGQATHDLILSPPATADAPERPQTIFFAPGAAAPQTGLDSLLTMLGERELDLDLNTGTQRVQGLQKGMRQMFMQMTKVVEAFNNKFAEFSGSVSATAKDGNIEANFALAKLAYADAYTALRATVITTSKSENVTPVLQALRAASGLQQFFSSDTTGGGKNLEIMTKMQADDLLNPITKALGNLSGKAAVSSMKYQEVRSTMDGVSELLKTRLNQMMDGFGRVNEVYDNLTKILTSTYQADADSRKSFLQ